MAGRKTEPGNVCAQPSEHAWLLSGWTFAPGANVCRMLDGFTERRIATGEAELYARIGGEGPPLVCLHGYPQSHLTWRKVAPLLAERYTVVLPDLRGYGASEIVASDGAHLAYSKRVMARDIVALMARLGYERFLLAGHDRGARVAYRLALDAPERVAALATPRRIIPTLENWEAMDYRRAFGAYHWQFLAQPAPLPERLIGSDPEWYCAQQIGSWLEDRSATDDAALEAYCQAFARPGAVHAACEDYRAGYTCDLEADRADRDAGRLIENAAARALGCVATTDKRSWPTSPRCGNAGRAISPRKDCAADTS